MGDTIELLQNLTLLVALHVIVGLVDLRRKTESWKTLVQGGLFGAVMVFGMVRAVELQRGVIYDGRSVIASLCGLFFGPVAAMIAASMGTAWCLLVAGPGTLTGILMIAVAAFLGAAFHPRRQQARGISLGFLLGFGYMVQLAMLALLFALPRALAKEVFERVFWTVMLAYPATTVLIGRLLSSQQTKLHFVQGMREKLESLQATFHSMGDGVIATDVAGRVEQIDDEAQRLTGWKEAHALGRTLGEVLRVKSMRTGKEIDNPHGRLLKHGLLVAPEDHAILVPREGKQAPITYRATVIHDPRGGFGGMVLVFRHESPEQREQREFVESAGHYRALVDSGEVLAWTTGKGGLFDFFNSPWLSFTGRTLAEEIGEGWFQDIVSADRDRFREAYHRAFETQQPFHLVVQLRRHDGEYRRVLSSAKPLRDAVGAFCGYVGQAIDITDLLRAQNRHENLLQMTPAGIAVLNTLRDASGMPIDYWFQDANPAMERLLDVPIAKLVDQPICQVMPDIDSEWLEVCERVALTGLPTAFDWHSKADGKEFRMQVFRPTKNELGILLVELTTPP